MRTVFQNKKISGILAVLPENEVRFEEEITNYSFSEKQTIRLKKIMGYEKHRLAKMETTPSDLCIFGIDYLLSKELLDLNDIGAIITVSITPDFWIPHISNIIHGHYNMSQDVLCVDLAQGCSGFILGLMEAFMILEHMPEKKILLLNADVLSHRVSNRDRNSFPLVGDAATVTIVENKSNESDIYFNIKSDGTRREALIIPAGGTRTPSSSLTAEMVDDGDGNYRSLDNMKMDGAAVFTFAQTEVPALIDEILHDAGTSKENIKWYLLHQPNKFMLQKLADRIGVPHDKVPMNIVELFGNSSGSSIPLDIAHNLKTEMKQKKEKCCMCAFGSGLTWCAMILELGEMDFCETFISKG